MFKGKQASHDFFGTGVEKFDLGLGVGLALELKKFIISLNGEFGMLKIQDISVNNQLKSVKNTNFSLGVGYKF